MRSRSGEITALLASVLLAPALLTRLGGADATVAGPADDAVVRHGAEVFQATCAACHGSDGTGRAGSGIDAGPSLVGLPVAAVDVVLRTGRMPIARPELGVRVDRLGDEDRESLLTWMRARLDLPGTIPRPGAGDATRGLEPFVRHCAACHGAGGTGGVAGGGTFVPAIAGVDPVTIVEAIRVGPFEMPAFSPAVLDDDTAADIAAYLMESGTGRRTLLGLDEIDPVGVAVAAAVLLAAAVAVLRAVANRPASQEES